MSEPTPAPPHPDTPPGREGLIGWMIHNRITPNLLMIFLILGGLYMSTKIKQEVFPEFSEDAVSVKVAVPGASPEEVEQSVVLAVEEAVRGLEGVKEVTSTAGEGSGSIRVEILNGADIQRLSNEIKQEVDRIRTFPTEAEEPQVNIDARRRDVLSLLLYGDVPESVLRELTEHVRDRLLQSSGITQVDFDGERNFEVHIEIPEATLRTYGLTLNEVATRLRRASVDVPGGKIETSGGEVLLRVKDRREWAKEFARIPLITTPDGSVIHLSDVATVSEGFEDSDRYASYNGKRSLELEVFRVGDQTPIGVSDAVKAAMEDIAPELPPGIEWAIKSDMSEMYRDRLKLLLKNAFFGLVLVLLVLGLFLDLKLAFWVTMGIPTSFLGGLLFLPGMDVSINMISLFAFIMALGIVVDDAIIAGENIYEYRERGMSFFQAALQGARDVSMPIAFSILTNVVAFIPLYFIPGSFGKFWQSIPLVVVTVFLISWFEALFILPSHLAHIKEKRATRLGAWIHDRQQAFARLTNRFIQGMYAPFLDTCLRWRGLTVACGVAVLIGVLGYVKGGRIHTIFMPRTESDRAVVTAILPLGSPLSQVQQVEKALIQSLQRVAAANSGPQLLTGTFSSVKENVVEITGYLTAPEIRKIGTSEITSLWRTETGSIAGLQSLKFESDRGGPGSGAALSVELSHLNDGVLDRASAALAERLTEFPDVKDIDDGYTAGKPQLDFRLRPEGQSLGLTSEEVARQVRNSFYGAEVLRQQRGRHEVKVVARLPDSERQNEYTLENLLITTPAGTRVPLSQIADIERGHAFTSIKRRDGRRTVTVTADVSPIGETETVIARLDATVLPELVRDFPGLTAGYEGRQADMKESMSGIVGGFILALLGIYFLLAIPFRSYLQPLIVMVSIPFGTVGAVLGHILMGYDLSLMSFMGIIALAGVAVNDSLVLIDYSNVLRREGMSPGEAIRNAGVRRFRPILLTTLTTFGGLAPMILETSRQARFLIPMALSLGYGILFATVITLLLVPCLYMLIEDFIAWLRSLRNPDDLEEPVPDTIG